MITKLIEVYFKLNSWKEGNYKSCQIITWRFITNLTKYTNGYNVLVDKNICSDLVYSIDKIFDELKDNNNLITAVIQAMNNLFVCKEKEVFDLLGDKVIKFSKALWDFTGLSNDTAVLCALNLVCSFYEKEKL